MARSPHGNGLILHNELAGYTEQNNIRAKLAGFTAQNRRTSPDTSQADYSTFECRQQSRFSLYLCRSLHQIDPRQFDKCTRNEKFANNLSQYTRAGSIRSFSRTPSITLDCAAENERYCADNTHTHKQFCLAKRKMNGFLRSPVQCATSPIACVCLQHQVNTNPFRGSLVGFVMLWQRDRASVSATVCILCEMLYESRALTAASVHDCSANIARTHMPQSTGLRDRHRCGPLVVGSLSFNRLACFSNSFGFFLFCVRARHWWHIHTHAASVDEVNVRDSSGTRTNAWRTCVCESDAYYTRTHRETYYLLWAVWISLVLGIEQKDHKTALDIFFTDWLETNSWILSVNLGDFVLKTSCLFHIHIKSAYSINGTNREEIIRWPFHKRDENRRARRFQRSCGIRVISVFGWLEHMCGIGCTATNLFTFSSWRIQLHAAVSSRLQYGEPMQCGVGCSAVTVFMTYRLNKLRWMAA